MANQSRQQRRAEARAREKASSAVDRVDPALMQLLTNTSAKYQRASKEAAATQAALQEIAEQVRKTHGLADGDQINMSTGQITRAPRKTRKRTA